MDIVKVMERIWMKIMLLVLFAFTAVMGSVAPKVNNIAMDITLKEQVFLNSYMLDFDVTKSYLENYLKLGFLTPEEDSWLYIIDYHKAAILAVQAEDYKAVQRVWETVAKKYDDEVSQYNLGRLYELQLIPDLDNELAIYWYSKAERNIKTSNLSDETLEQNISNIWQFKKLDEIGIVYYTYGSSGAQNQFGFLKLVNSCNDDYLWLRFLEAGVLETDDLDKVSVELESHLQTYRLDLNVSRVYNTDNGDGILLFTPIITGQHVIDEYKNIDLLDISIISPNYVVENLYSTHMNVNMTHFNDIQEEAQRRCTVYTEEINLMNLPEDLNDSNITNEMADEKIEKVSLFDMSRYWILFSIVLLSMVVGIRYRRKNTISVEKERT